jgi:cell division protein FtsI/penicillin-binding protein 2
LVGSAGQARAVPAPLPGAGLFRDSDAAEELWPVLEAGLHNVVVRGTAKVAFAKSPLRDARTRSERPRLLAKTGTAQVGRGRVGPRERYNTAWFAGLLRGDDRRGVARDIAFACMVTHSAGTGGDVCAPLMRDILQKLDDRPPPGRAG